MESLLEVFVFPRLYSFNFQQTNKQRGVSFKLYIYIHTYKFWNWVWGSPEMLGQTNTGPNQCSLVLWMQDGYCWLSSCLYIHLPASSQNFQIIDFGIRITKVLSLKEKKRLKNRPKNHRFFVDSFKKTMSSLRFLKKPKLKIPWFSNFFQRTEADASLILKCLKNRSRQFFQKFKEPPNTVPNRVIPYCYKASSGVSVCVKYS